MRRALLGVGISAALVVSGAAAAEAATAAPAGKAAVKNTPCVTPAEFGLVKSGQSKARVAKIFGTKGTLEQTTEASGYTLEVRSYKACKAADAVVRVQFASGQELPAKQVGSANAKIWVEAWV